MTQPLPKNRYDLGNSHVIDRPEGKQKAGIRLYKTLNWLSSLFIKTVKFQGALLNFNSAKKYIRRNIDILVLAAPQDEQSNLNRKLVHLTTEKVIKYLNYLKNYQPTLLRPQTPSTLSVNPPSNLQTLAPQSIVQVETNSKTTPASTSTLDVSTTPQSLPTDLEVPAEAIPPQKSETDSPLPDPTSVDVPTPIPAPVKPDERPVLNMDTVTPGVGPFRVRKKPLNAQPKPAPKPIVISSETPQPAAVIKSPDNTEATLTRIPLMNMLSDFQDLLGPDPKAGGSKSASINCGMLEGEILMQTLRVNYYIANTGESVIVEEVNTPCTAIESTEFHKIRMIVNKEVKHICELPAGVDTQVIENLRNEHLSLWVKQFAQLQSNEKNNQPKLENPTNTTGPI